MLLSASSRKKVEPEIDSKFKITKEDNVVTAGSCFAQHISKYLISNDFNFLVTENFADHEIERGERAIYSARYGNIYSTLQLRQTFERAYGLRHDRDTAWTRPDGRLVFPTRQQEFAEGFRNKVEMEVERQKHDAAIRRALETCSIFVFTLGLTETWTCDQDGCAVTNAPGVIAEPDDAFTYSFRNLSVTETIESLETFIHGFREVNPEVNIILTVSPVPMIATYENNNVVISNTYSKAVLRVAAYVVSRSFNGVVYFPSYEMVSSFPGSNFYEADKRSVRPDAVAHVMDVFKKRFMSDTEAIGGLNGSAQLRQRVEILPGISVARREFFGVVCDEEANENILK